MKLKSVALVAALSLAASFAACAETVLNVYAPQGVVASIEKYISPIMKSRYDTRVVITPVLSGQALTKAVAQRASPEISVFMLDEGPWLQGKQAGLWDSLDGVKNIADIPARFRDKDSQGSAFLLYLLGIIYDEKALAALGVKPPTSYADLWNPALKGKVTIPDSNSTFSYALLFKVNDMEPGGDHRKSVDAGFKKLSELRPNIGVFHGGASTLIPLFSQRQAAIGFNASFPAQRLAADGLPIRWVAPKEGAIAVASYVAVAKNAPARDAAKTFVDLVLSPQYQGLQTEASYSGFVHPKTQLSPAFEKNFVIKPADMQKATLMDWETFLGKRRELTTRWQREVEAK